MKLTCLFSWYQVGITLVLFSLCACGSGKKNKPSSQQNNTTTTQNNTIKTLANPTDFKVDFAVDKAQKTTSGLSYIITQEGSGIMPSKGKKASVHYTGKLIDNQVLHTSGTTPFWFRLGSKSPIVINGFEESVMLLKTGGKGKFLIPPSLAYGDEGYDIIPPKATLYYEIELVEVK